MNRQFAQPFYFAWGVASSWAKQGWVCGLFALLVSFHGTAWGQLVGAKVSRIEIKHVGPPAASDALIRANIRIKPGDVYRPEATIDDINNLYATGFFYNIQVAEPFLEDGGVVLTYVVQGKPRLTDIKIQGNKKLSTTKIKKKITSKIGEPLDERKLFTDSQAIQQLYQKSGYPKTEAKFAVNIDPNTGRGAATFEITESPKVKIERVDFVGAQAFTEKELRKQIKTRDRWWLSWLTGSGVFKDEQFEEDRLRLAEYYRDHGYIDFEIKDVQFENSTPGKMIIRFHVYEGRQYKVGQITFIGTTMLPTNAISPIYDPGPTPASGPERKAWSDNVSLWRNFAMKPGRIFTGKGLQKNITAVEDFYGIKGHIDVTTSTGNLRVKRVANTETGTMDLEVQVNEGQPSFIEKIEIRGNTKTKDKVIRRELAVSPGETFNMVGVKLSKRRLEGLRFFAPGKVDLRPEPTEIPNRKDLVVSVEETPTGNMTVGAGFSSVDSLVGFVELTQGNFDLFNPPNFTGGGQKFRLRVQLGTERQDFIVSFEEPWFLDRKLALGVELYHTEKDYQSQDDLYDEVRTGARLSLTRALGSDFLIGSVSYNLENVGILVEDSVKPQIVRQNQPGRGESIQVVRGAPDDILKEDGYTLLSKVGASIAYDTRNSTFLPDAGQRTDLFGEVASKYLGSERDFYKLQLTTAWYFRGFLKGHVLELVGRTGVADGIGGDEVPFYERYYLGGLYSLRGFEYRDISPREPGFDEPIGGDTFWFGSAEYSIPIIKKENAGVRFAVFYDIGSVRSDAYDYTFEDFSDNWGVGLRLELPIGPLRLDYGIPIHHDEFSNGKGRFQFGVGWQRPF
jgi:outer membrane protein insertion porin family